MDNYLNSSFINENKVDIDMFVASSFRHFDKHSDRN